jgi:DNA-binding GntR family transcriptional regulator
MSVTHLKQQAYDEILRRIMSGLYVPGDLLNRRGMAGELNMSMAPVHEAMLQLQHDGLLEVFRRQGTRVRTVSRESVRGNLIVREALECQAARMICGSRHADRLEALKPKARTIDSLSVGDEKRPEIEVAFHVDLVGCADCPALSEEYERIMRIGLFYHINLLMGGTCREPENWHLSLLEGLSGDTPEEAPERMRRHIWLNKPVSL